MATLRQVRLPGMACHAPTPPRELAREIIRRSVLSGSSGGRSFSSDISDVREAPSSLPKAPFSPIARERVSFSDAAPSDRPESREKIDAIYLSPDAFARRTDEASIAE